MALTKKKRLYVEARDKMGKSITDSAIYAGCPEKTARQAGSRLEKDPDIASYRQRLAAGEDAVEGSKPVKPRVVTKREPKEVAAAPPMTGEDGKAFVTDDPIAFLKKQMNMEGEDPKLRQDAAKALLPYMYARLGEKGKKEKQEEEAKKTTGKTPFSPRVVAK